MTRRRPLLRWRLAMAGLGLAAVAFILTTRWSPVLAGHPAYPLTLALVAAASAVVALSAVLARGESSGRRAALSHRRLVAGVVVSILTVAVLGVLVWLRPLGATSRALDALADGRGIDVTQSATRITLRPWPPDRRWAWSSTRARRWTPGRTPRSCGHSPRRDIWW